MTQRIQPAGAPRVSPRSWALRLRAALAGLAMLATAGGSAAADEFPSRPITFIVPAAAGGTTDTVARIVAQIIQTQTGKSIVVDNRAGASGSIGVLGATRARPDGYTLLFAIQDAVTIYPLLNKDAPYRVDRDFTPITQFATANVAYFVNSKSKIRTLNELVQLARDKPNGVSYASAGYGTTSHFALEMLKLTNGLEVIHVPYKGSGPQMLAVVSDEVTFTSTTPVGAKGFIESGQLRPLATTGKTRNAVIPTVPTIAETGLAPFTVEVWFGLLGPARLPPPIASALDLMLRNAVNSPEFRKQADALGLDMSRPLSLGEFEKDLAAETLKWERLIRESKMSLGK